MVPYQHYSYVTALRFLQYRQGHGKACHAFGSAGDFHRPTVSVDDMFDNGKAKPGAPNLTRSRFIDAIKPLSQAAKMFFCDTLTDIGH